MEEPAMAADATKDMACDAECIVTDSSRRVKYADQYIERLSLTSQAAASIHI